MIELEHVVFQHARAQAATLRDVSLTLNPGELLGILGPNGAGKSTLLRVMMGLLTPRAGHVRCEGRSLSDMSREQIAKRIAFVPQSEPSVFSFRVYELVALGRSPHTGLFGGLEASDHQAVRESLAATQTTALSDRMMTELSGGELKRVLIARALAQRCPVLLLDEPVASLDLSHQMRVCELLAEGVSQGRFTAAVVLHDLNLASQFCTRVVVLHDGVVAANGAPEDVFTPSLLERVWATNVRTGTMDNGLRYYLPSRVR